MGSLSFQSIGLIGVSAKSILDILKVGFFVTNSNIYASLIIFTVSLAYFVIYS